MDDSSNQSSPSPPPPPEAPAQSQMDAAKLRAEIRRRKILQRGDERIKRLFGHSQDEDASLMPAGEVAGTENRDKQLIEQILMDSSSNSSNANTPTPPIVSNSADVSSQSSSVGSRSATSQSQALQEAAAQFAASPAISNAASTATNMLKNFDTMETLAQKMAGGFGIDLRKRLQTDQLKAQVANLTAAAAAEFSRDSNLTNKETEMKSEEVAATNTTSATTSGKPNIDLKLFERYERRASLGQHQSKVELWLMQSMSFISLKAHLLVFLLIKILFAAFSSYFDFNFIPPFLLAHLTGMIYLDIANHVEINKAKFVFRFIKGLFHEFPAFAFVYIIVQALKTSLEIVDIEDKIG